jgi:hypothetical protein
MLDRVRLCLLALCGGLLLLSSRPAEAAERREPGLLEPVRRDLEGDSQGGRLIRRACHRIRVFQGRRRR